jgi:hypothetical protein
MKALCSQLTCDEVATFVCTCCHDFYCSDHMEGYICLECDDDLWGDDE